MKVKKFNPKHLETFMTDFCTLILYQEGLSENGGPSLAVNEQKKCRFIEKTKTVFDTDGKKIMLLGQVIFVGDVAPGVRKISDGKIIVDNAEYTIYKASRPKNPDGSVHHTTLELI